MTFKIYDLIDNEKMYEDDYVTLDNEYGFREYAVKLMEDYFELGGTPYGYPIKTLMKYITTDKVIELLHEYNYKVVIEDERQIEEET